MAWGGVGFGAENAAFEVLIREARILPSSFLIQGRQQMERR
jgi:hypothetical protein